ncbi:EamA family transporter [Chloroflexota bacterium]
MNWTSTAILSAAILGVVNIIDSHLLSRRLPSLRAFLLPVSSIHLVYGLLLFYLFPLPEGTSLWTVLVAIGAGICRTVAAIIMLYNLKKEDVSRVIPVVYTYPIFVAIMAVPLLGESLYYLEWLAIVIVVAGAVIISAEKSPSGATSRLGRPFLLLFVSSLLCAVADIANKYALAYISFWNAYSITMLCLSSIFLLASLRPHIIRQLRDMKQRNSSITLLAFNETLALVGIVLSFWAMERGPVSLVSTIIGSRPVFVAIYSLVLGLVLPQFLIRSTGKGMLVLRLVAIFMIVGGIAMIYLT